MPDNPASEYNPVITGFSREAGPLDISLNQAKQIYGQLPSKYGFVSTQKPRSGRKTLNLDTGYLVRALLSDKTKDLKNEVYDFFREWHRDLDAEFGVDIRPFYNIHPSRAVRDILRKNQGPLLYLAGLDIKKTLVESQLIRKDVLNSIRPDQLLEKCIEILNRKIKSRAFSGPAKTDPAADMLKTLGCFTAVKHLMRYSGTRQGLPAETDIACYTDDIAKQLFRFHQYRPLSGINPLSRFTGKGVEFEYAPRDHTYLALGKITGDCTADKRNFQADHTIENIFWTVFSWILDRNYQILKVYLDGEFVMKVHLLPLYVTGNMGYGDFDTSASIRSDYMFLAIDAIETTVAFRNDPSQKAGKDDTGLKKKVFLKTISFIKTLARQMNIDAVYAEKFSNTPWVREILASFPEIFFHADHLMKVDQLEDVFCLADRLSRNMGVERPGEIFMELQLKNTYLSPGYINKAPGLKSFALICGDAGDGIPMKQVIGI